ncbi:MAG TPA: glutaminyl-peptide cyclotransferase [Pyrinomonadaceae bacterium]|nr:glutaminyl-peptide cyclotransferase [Pyrinomonadaceae bacterium]
MRILLICIAAVAFLACGGPSNVNNTTVKSNSTPRPTPSGPAPVYTYDIVKTYPHDPNAFTEGLYFKDGFLYESTGEPKHSSLRKVALETGKVVQKWDLPPEDFGEGISEINGKIYQLTWQQELGRVFDANDFKLLQEFNYQGEGWGMTTDGTNLIFDQGTQVLKFMDPNTFKTVKTLPVVREDGQPQMQINELEWIKGEIWANIWHSEQSDILGKPNYIARIDPNSGRIIGWIDLGGISPDDVSRDPENTLNGIAYDAANDRIFVTGKKWKNLFEIKVKPKAQ